MQQTVDESTAQNRSLQSNAQGFQTQLGLREIERERREEREIGMI